MNRYELAVYETQSVLSEWIDPALHIRTTEMTKAIVDRLIAKGVIQSTNPNDLVDFRGEGDEQPTGYVTPVHPPRAPNQRPTS